MESTIEITPPQVALALSLLFVSVLFLRRFVVKSSLDNVPGPARTSWFSGRSFMPSQVNATHSQPHCPGNMNEYFAPDCWEYRDDLGRKYPRVALLHGMFGAMYDVFIKELDTYPEPVEYVQHSLGFTILGRILTGFFDV